MSPLIETYSATRYASVESEGRALNNAYASGRSDEREQWVPLANLLRAAFHGKQDEGSVTLSLAEVLSLSVALQRAEGG
jgi:hypothetical protein